MWMGRHVKCRLVPVRKPQEIGSSKSAPQRDVFNIKLRSAAEERSSKSKQMTKCNACCPGITYCANSRLTLIGLSHLGLSSVFISYVFILFLKVCYFFFRVELSDKWSSSGQFLEQKEPERQLERNYIIYIVWKDSSCNLHSMASLLGRTFSCWLAQIANRPVRLQRLEQ